ncbi:MULTISPECIES: metal-dependent hydrolase [unclassified Rothia (in: high G+C Gram-positive bacteria)]|uniref:metal-dependent hydrolase n=1 Tax=unclassified Rothia (in: high G+C Gram-positive bacteria) TaxID=2689056 RepID=UPI00195E6EEC|nr:MULTISPECIES: metal-dependent hydrolase [unclassified Rothia (in: high G+C Gram-positive bacteria)]MBM7050583.1 metal-dependent hydrolase [Rothia sp. ZJ1223]QRZ60775.1 metal-dependent hydrolase [Rothia sp. ZJ932]
MMGYSHSVTAAGAWLLLHELGITPTQDASTLVVTTLACAGAGMFPDADHKKGTIAHSIPPLTNIAVALIATISGGHRKGTHSILGVLVFWAIAYFAQELSYQGIPWISLILTGFAGGLALRVFGAPGGWIGAIGLGYLAWTTQSLWLIPWAIFTGCIVHILGDMLTTRGVNILWPLVIKPPVPTKIWRKSGYFALPVLGDAGSARENMITSAVTLYILWYAGAFFSIFSSYPLEFSSALLGT